MDSAEGLRGAAAPSLSSTLLRPSLVLPSSVGARVGNSFPMPLLPFARGREGKGRAVYVLRHAVITGHLILFLPSKVFQDPLCLARGQNRPRHWKPHHASRSLSYFSGNIFIISEEVRGGGKNTRSSERVGFFKLTPKVKCLEKPFFSQGSASEMGPALRCLKIPYYKMMRKSKHL